MDPPNRDNIKHVILPQPLQPEFVLGLPRSTEGPKLEELPGRRHSALCGKGIELLTPSWRTWILPGSLEKYHQVRGFPKSETYTKNLKQNQEEPW